MPTDDSGGSSTALGSPRKVAEGSLTLDGTGAGFVDIVIPAGHFLRAVHIGNADPTLPMTGGTVTAQDNGGIGTVHSTFTQATDGTRKSVEWGRGIRSVTTPLRLTAAGGGAGRKFQYSVVTSFGPLPAASIDSPFAYYDFTNSEYLYADTARTVRANPGDAVGSVYDRSGNGGHLIQATAASRPLWTPTAALPGLTFDGSNDYMDATQPTFAQPVTAIAVVRPGAIGAVGKRVFDNQGGGTPRIIIDHASTQQWQCWSGAFVGTAAAPDNTSAIIVANYDGANSKIWVGGGAAVTGNAGANAAGGAFRLGWEQAFVAGFAWLGVMAEIALYPSLLSLADINIRGAALSTKHSVSWSTAS